MRALKRPRGKSEQVNGGDRRSCTARPICKPSAIIKKGGSRVEWHREKQEKSSTRQKRRIILLPPSEADSDIEPSQCLWQCQDEL